MPGIYQLLAQECEPGLIPFAYAAYKEHKAEVLQAIEIETGRPATQEDLHAFYRIASAPAELAMYVQRGEVMLHSLIDHTLDVRWNELENQFITTKIGEQLQILQAQQQQKRSWRGWAADVSGNLAVNFVTILVIAGLLFGFRGLDGMLANFGHRADVLEVQHGAPK